MTVRAPLPHDAAQLHVTGQARYVDDIPTPANAVHLAFGLSPIAAGRLVSVDLTAVRTAPGVIGAWTPDDLGANPDCSPSLHDEPLLSDGTIHYLGQPLFLVAAVLMLGTTRRIARWQRALAADASLPAAHEVLGVRRLVMIETHLVAVIPLAAVFLARGYGA